MGGLEGARYGLLLREPLRGPRHRPRLSPPVSRRGGRRGPAALTEVLPTLSGLCPRSPNRSHEAVSAYQRAVAVRGRRRHLLSAPPRSRRALRKRTRLARASSPGTAAC